MKKITLLLSILALSFTSPNLAAQEFSENAKAEMAKYNFQPAIDELTSFLKSDPNNEIFLTNRAHFYTRTGENEKAITDVTKLLSLNPKNTNALITLATAKIALGNIQEGIESLNQALTIDPKLKPALLIRAQAFYRLNQTEKAFADLNFVIKEDPHYLEAYVYRGQMNTGIAKFSAARDDFNFILKNSRAGSNYYKLATNELSSVSKIEAESKMVNSKVNNDDASVTKVTDQMSSLTKEVTETTKRITDFSLKNQKVLEDYVVQINAVPKDNHDKRTKLYSEIHSKVKLQISTIQKEINSMKGKEHYAMVSRMLEKNIDQLQIILDRTSPYAARRKEYVETVNAADMEINTHFKKMLEYQKSSNQAEFERNKYLASGKLKNLMETVNEAKEDLLKIDAVQFRQKDELKFTNLLADYTKTLASIDTIRY